MLVGQKIARCNGGMLQNLLNSVASTRLRAKDIGMRKDGDLVAPDADEWLSSRNTVRDVARQFFR
jgi:hypothetical protein